MVLPEDELATRLQQLVQAPSDGVGIGHGAQHLNAEHGIHVSILDAVLLHDICVLDTAGDYGVLVSDVGLLDLAL
jgi:hypothetical protein